MPNKLSDDKQRISASLDKKLIELVKAKAESMGVSFTELLKDSLVNYICLEKDINQETNKETEKNINEK